MATLIPLFTDNFTRADENPLSDGGKWSVYVETVSNPLQLVSNAAEATTVNARNTSYVSGVSFPNNQWASCTIDSITTPNNGSIRVRLTNSGGCYAALWNTSTMTIYSFNGGGFNPLATSAPQTISAGDVILFTAVGTILTLYHNGIPIASASDSLFASGAPGLGSNPGSSLTTITFSRFSAGKFINGAGLLLGVG